MKQLTNHPNTIYDVPFQLFSFQNFSSFRQVGPCPISAFQRFSVSAFSGQPIALNRVQSRSIAVTKGLKNE
jgi:hypothetical protein